MHGSMKLTAILILATLGLQVKAGSFGISLSRFTGLSIALQRVHSSHEDHDPGVYTPKEHHHGHSKVEYTVPQVLISKKKTLPKSVHTTYTPHHKSESKRASCVVGGGGSCATAVTGRGFLERGIYSNEDKDRIQLCCVSYLKYRPGYGKKFRAVTWSVSTVEYSDDATPWLSLKKIKGIVHFGYDGRPRCNDAVLELAYHSDDLLPGEYVAKIHISSRDKNSGEWGEETDTVIQTRLIVVDPPSITFKKYLVDRRRGVVDFVASIDASNKKLHIASKSIKLTVGDPYHPGKGAITDVVPYRHETIVKGSVALKDPFESQKTHFAIKGWGIAQRHYKTCGKVEIEEQTHFCHPPICRLFAVDAAYCGGEGLVTANPSAQFVLACTQKPHICKDCFSVTGPRKWAIESFTAVPDDDKTFNLKVIWDKYYYGPVHVGVLGGTSYTKGCALDLTKPYECGNTAYTKISHVEGIFVRRTANVAVQSLSFKILSKCSGEDCEKHDDDEHFEDQFEAANYDFGEDYQPYRPHGYKDYGNSHSEGDYYPSQYDSEEGRFAGHGAPPAMDMDTHSSDTFKTNTLAGTNTDTPALTTLTTVILAAIISGSLCLRTLTENTSMALDMATITMDGLSSMTTTTVGLEMITMDTLSLTTTIIVTLAGITLGTTTHFQSTSIPMGMDTPMTLTTIRSATTSTDNRCSVALTTIVSAATTLDRLGSMILTTVTLATIILDTLCDHFDYYGKSHRDDSYGHSFGTDHYGQSLLKDSHHDHFGDDHYGKTQHDDSYHHGFSTDHYGQPLDSHHDKFDHYGKSQHDDSHHHGFGADHYGQPLDSHHDKFDHYGKTQHDDSHHLGFDADHYGQPLDSHHDKFDHYGKSQHDDSHHHGFGADHYGQSWDRDSHHDKFSDNHYGKSHQDGAHSFGTDHYGRSFVREFNKDHFGDDHYGKTQYDDSHHHGSGADHYGQSFDSHHDTFGDDHYGKSHHDDTHHHDFGNDHYGQSVLKDSHHNRLGNGQLLYKEPYSDHKHGEKYFGSDSHDREYENQNGYGTGLHSKEHHATGDSLGSFFGSLLFNSKESHYGDDHSPHREVFGGASYNTDNDVFGRDDYGAEDNRGLYKKHEHGVHDSDGHYGVDEYGQAIFKDHHHSHTGGDGYDHLVGGLHKKHEHGVHHSDDHYGVDGYGQALFKDQHHTGGDGYDQHEHGVHHSDDRYGVDGYGQAASKDHHHTGGDGYDQSLLRDTRGDPYGQDPYKDSTDHHDASRAFPHEHHNDYDALAQPKFSRGSSSYDSDDIFGHDDYKLAGHHDDFKNGRSAYGDDHGSEIQSPFVDSALYSRAEKILAAGPHPHDKFGQFQNTHSGKHDQDSLYHL
ncbi:hypothetical protein BSKO_09020 [Bryopsis sp. KO-2023]|nr:hypothetical protein BSKO_09020 [Bryopsis sp. KO-2023]